MPHSLTDLPVEVLIDNVLPAVDLADLGSLAATNKVMAAICADDTFWKRKCLDDFNFHSGETARTSGWKVLYRGLFRPMIFVWGYVLGMNGNGILFTTIAESDVTGDLDYANFPKALGLGYLIRSSFRALGIVSSP